MDFFEQDYLKQFCQPQHKPICSTDENEQSLLRIIDQDPIFQPSLQEFHYFEDMESEKQDDNQSIQQKRQTFMLSQSPKKKGLKKTKKNSNAIKKMGRIILSNLEQYKIDENENEGVCKLMKKLNQRYNSKAKSLVDGFNTYHLQALFDIQNQIVSSYNLRTTRRIFTRLLRNEVLNSFQIKGDNKMLYLNTLKCSSLRFINKKLANRLQTSQNQN